MAQLDKESEKWIQENEALVHEGEEIVRVAISEALDYMTDVTENINDREWRKMSMSSQVVEMGIGVILAEHVIPNIYKDMEKSMHRKLKVPKHVARALRHIFIGRVIKNVRKGLDERAK